jgi:hypothetical protein
VIATSYKTEESTGTSAADALEQRYSVGARARTNRTHATPRSRAVLGPRSPDGSTIWVTVTGALPGYGGDQGAVIELPAFGE